METPLVSSCLASSGQATRPAKFIRKPDVLAAFRALPLIPEFELAILLDMLKM
jgi:hypothetical protein